MWKLSWYAALIMITKRNASWCRSTRAMSWLAGCGRVWRGFDGGQDARAVIEDFFATVAARSKPRSRGFDKLSPQSALSLQCALSLSKGHSHD